MSRSSRNHGFTLIELMAVVATIATLAALLLPVLDKAKIKAQRTNCMSNLRSLGFAWLMYAQDNGGHLAQSFPISNPHVWIEGDMTDASQAVDLSYIQRGKLYPYNQNHTIYRCPTDRGSVVTGKGPLAKVRSYSMNCFMGGRESSTAIPAAVGSRFIPFFTKDSDLRRPAELWVLLDEDENSINDGFFITDPSGKVWYDFPSISSHRHNYSFALNFADGHSEVWNHRDRRTKSVKVNQTEQFGNTDLQRLAQSSTLPR